MACVVCANEGTNKENEIHKEKSEIKSINDEIEVECGYLDSLNNQRNNKQKIELNMESKAVVDETSSAAPNVSLRDRGVAGDSIMDENHGRTEFIPTTANDEVYVKHAEEDIVEQDNSSHSAGEDNCDKQIENDRDIIYDTSYFEAEVKQILEERPEVIKTSEIGEKPDQVMDEEKPALSLNVVKSFDDTRAEEINEQVTQKTNEDSESKESDDSEHEFEHESAAVEAACAEQEKPAVKRKEITSVTRVRAYSEQRSGTNSHVVSRDISSALRSGSLESMKLYRQPENTTKGSRTAGLTYSPPANATSPVGHLRREKKPARMLRHTSFDTVCYVLNLCNVNLWFYSASCLTALLTCSFEDYFSICFFFSLDVPCLIHVSKSFSSVCVEENYLFSQIFRSGRVGALILNSW